ncbi:hypothetical protein ACFQZO_33020 [Bradyrhizobium sp. GCM10027634]|nr:MULTISPECIES: hypothetical protein [unclassified Bradyrhizobium]MDN5005676.1 hypothetical protein [Bradyrhizobium sp. WYCCWR 12677]
MLNAAYLMGRLFATLRDVVADEPTVSIGRVKEVRASWRASNEDGQEP